MARSNVNIFNGTYRSLCWDEENRLMSVTDFEDGGNFSTASAYVYNAGGERVWKFAGQIERMSLNGDLYVDVAQMSSRTLYANPYLVATDQQYTKHYFIETERIASKLGGGFGMVDNPVDQYFAIAPLEGSLEDHSDNLQQHIINSFSCSADVELGAEIILHGIEDFADLDDAEEELYFTHSDHLGSSSFITDASGEAVQHLQYLPFGEHFVSQTSSGWESRYTFSGKEKDVETGYSYFGARYYDSDISVWLSVDPLADKYPSMSAFMYTAGNPVMLVDPDGREFDDPNDVTRARNSQTEARNRVAELNNNIKALESKESLTDSEKQTLADSKDQVKVLEDHVSHLEEMITTDKVKYKYRKIEGTGVSAGTSVENGVVVMDYIDGRLDKQAHEETHGYQYLSGDLKIVDGVEDFSYSDLGDEAKAYQTEYSYRNAEDQRGFRERLGVSEVKGVKDITPENLAKSSVIQKFYPQLVKDFIKTQKKKK